MKKIVVILIGIALLAGVIATGRYGLAERDKEIYRQAVSLEETAEFGFGDFRFFDYPVAFYYGDIDYALTYQIGDMI